LGGKFLYVDETLDGMASGKSVGISANGPAVIFAGRLNSHRKELIRKAALLKKTFLMSNKSREDSPPGCLPVKAAYVFRKEGLSRENFTTLKSRQKKIFRGGSDFTLVQ